MTFDFSALGTTKSAKTLTNPRQLFEALPTRAEQYEFLRDPQGQVLEGWYGRKDERDLVIKMNTGAGKTIIGLLICQSSLNEGKGPALYVAPDPYLADQALREGLELGLEMTDDPRATKFLAGNTICVTSIKKLFNGRSVFGLEGSGRPSTNVGTVIVDDAHAAMRILEEQTALVVPATSSEYNELLALFADALSEQSATTYLDIKEGSRTAVAVVPFWSWQRNQARVAAILRNFQNDQQGQFTWPFVHDLLPICHAIFSRDGLQICPPCPPVDKVASFQNAGRRIYLTATLADDGVLVTHFDADPESVAKPVTPAGAGHLGDRLILAPQEITPAITEEEIRQAVHKFAAERNVVVLVPSHRRAALWDEFAKLTASKSDEIADAVDRLRAAHVGLVVLVNKYDGIDLPDDACRILVIDGLPEAYSGSERRERAILGDSEAMVGRQLQRLEQGMGRGVRSTNDHCVVLLMGAHLSRLIATPGNLQKLGEATRAQIELSREVAVGLEGKPMNDLAGVMQQVLGRDQSWIEAARGRLAELVFAPGEVGVIPTGRRQAFNRASIGLYDQAVQALRSSVNAAPDERLKGGLQEQLAAYQNFTDQVAAQRTLEGALRINRYVLRPQGGVAYHRIRAGAAQAEQAAAFLRERYGTAADLQLSVSAMFDDLIFDPDRVPEFEAAMALLGQHLGFIAQRPEADTGTGPDVLWALGDNQYFVIEAKSGAVVEKIWRKDVEQVGHSMNWFGENYDQTGNARPALVHRSHVLDAQASPPPGTRVFNEESIAKIRDAYTSVVRALAVSGSWGDPVAVGEQLRHHNLLAAGFGDRFGVRPRRT